MCNRYTNYLRKAGLMLDMFGFEEFSETQIKIDFPRVEDEIYPDRFALVIRTRGAAPELAQMRWGLPGPAQFGAAPVTNVRNLQSPHWRALLAPEHRCLVPFTSFSEYEDASPKGKKVLRWFTPTSDRGACFAGIWRTWRGLRGTKAEQAAEGVREHLVFSFLTTEPNDLVRPIHAKAMPVVLTTPEEQREWLAAPADRVATIQARPLPPDALILDPTG